MKYGFVLTNYRLNNQRNTKLTIFLDFLLQIVVTLSLLSSRTARSKPAEETCRVYPVELSPLLLVPAYHDKTAAKRAHVRYLRVGLTDVCETLRDHVRRHFVTILVFVVSCFVARTRNLKCVF